MKKCPDVTPTLIWGITHITASEKIAASSINCGSNSKKVPTKDKTPVFARGTAAKRTMRLGPWHRVTSC